MEQENKSLVTRIEPETPESPVTISFKRRNVDMYYVFAQELETLGSSSLQGSLHIALFGIGFGAAVSLWVTVATVAITNPFIYATFFAVASVFSLLTLYFGIRSVIDLINARKQVKLIKEASPNRELKNKDLI